MGVNKVQLANGETIIDISDSTVTPETLAEGVTAHDASGRKITGKMIPGGGSSVQSDWNQTDSSAADFIKNKPFGDELTEIMPETELIGTESEGVYSVDLDIALFSGNEKAMKIKFDGVVYDCPSIDSGYGYPAFGNMMYMGGEDTGEPFVIAVMIEFGIAMLVVEDGKPHLIKIENMAVKTIDDVYIPTPVVFYEGVTNDDYIYIDPDKTTKATKGDIINAVKKASVFLAPESMLFGGIAKCPIRIEMYGEIEYATLIVMEQYNESTAQATYRVLHTAEYTPPTT